MLPFSKSLENTSGNYVGILWEYPGGFLWVFLWGFFWRFLWGILCEYSPLLTLPNHPSQLINVSLLCNQNWPRRGWKYLFPNIPNCHNCRYKFWTHFHLFVHINLLPSLYFWFMLMSKLYQCVCTNKPSLVHQVNKYKMRYLIFLKLFSANWDSFSRLKEGSSIEEVNVLSKFIGFNKRSWFLHLRLTWVPAAGVGKEGLWLIWN